jgi:hypothetical protein
MSIPSDIDTIFDIDEDDIDEKSEEVDMNISDDDINCILDVTDDVGHM